MYFKVPDNRMVVELSNHTVVQRVGDWNDLDKKYLSDENEKDEVSGKRGSPADGYAMARIMMYHEKEQGLFLIIELQNSTSSSPVFKPELIVKIEMNKHEEGDIYFLDNTWNNVVISFTNWPTGKRCFLQTLLALEEPFSKLFDAEYDEEYEAAPISGRIMKKMLR